MILNPVLAARRYGEIVNGIWHDQAMWMTNLEVPDDLTDKWINVASGMTVSHIYCNKDMIQPLQAAFVNIRSRGLIGELSTFDGCYSIRDIRGHPGIASAHSWGVAIDINAHENPLGKIGSMTREFAKCFTEAGFTWGGNFKRVDMMHFSLGF